MGCQRLVDVPSNLESFTMADEANQQCCRYPTKKRNKKPNLNEKVDSPDIKTNDGRKVLETVNLKPRAHQYQQRRHLHMNSYTKNLVKQQVPRQLTNQFQSKEDQLRKKLCSLRSWELTNHGLDHQKKKFKESEQSLKFTVLSYNVLAQHLLEDHSYLYKRTDPEALTWTKRGERIIREIKDTSADVLCFQEIQSDHFNNFYVPRLQAMGFNGIFKQRTGDKRDGCAIFYRHSMFELTDSRSVEYCKPNTQILNRDNIGLIALLSPRFLEASHGEKPFIVVATTHLLYNPRRHDIKLAQLQLLFAEIDLLAFHQGNDSTGSSSSPSNYRYHPTIVTGDFNLTPNSRIYEFITRGSLKYKGLCRKELTPDVQGHLLQDELIPPHLKITDGCQHLEAIDRRNSCSSSYDEASKIQNKPEQIFSSGQLSHKLQLQSVYPHRLSRLNGLPEVTTYQNEWVTVDYMFHK